MDVKKCDRCGNIYEKNNKHNLESNHLGQVHDTACTTTFGYSSEPFITGLTINSTHGQGKKLDLCDKCNGLLIDFLNNKEVKIENNPHVDYIPPASRPSKRKWGGFVIVD